MRHFTLDPHRRTRHHRRSRYTGPESLKRDPVHAGPWPGVGRIPLYGSPCQASTPGLHGQVNAPTQTRLSAVGGWIRAGSIPSVSQMQNSSICKKSVFVVSVRNINICERILTQFTGLLRTNTVAAKRDLLAERTCLGKSVSVSLRKNGP